MARIKLRGFRCDRCSHEWLPRESEQEPRTCPRCDSPYWDTPSQTNQSYEAFKATVEKTLQEAGRALTWTEIRAASGLRQKFPNNKWVHRMEEDIGLVREKTTNGAILWSLYQETDV